MNADATETTLTLGHSLVDGSPVTISPAMGHLSIYGTTAAGKTIAARSLFAQLAAANTRASNPKPVMALSSCSMFGYRQVAQKYGGASLSLKAERDSLKHETDGLSHNTNNTIERHSILAVDPDKMPRHGEESSECNAAYRRLLYIVLARYLAKDPMPHIIVDDMTNLLRHNRAAPPPCTLGVEPLFQALRTCRSHNAMVVFVVGHPRALLDLDPGTRRLITDAGATLMLGPTHSALWSSSEMSDLFPPSLADILGQLRLCSGQGLLATPGGGLATLNVDPSAKLLTQRIREQEMHSASPDFRHDLENSA